MAADIEQVAAIALQTGGLGIEAFHRLLGDRHDLGGLEGRGGGEADVGGHCHAVHLLIFGDAGVLVVAAGGVVEQVAEQNAGLFGLGRVGQKGRGVLAERSGKGSKLGGKGLELLEVSHPGLVGGVHILDGPAVGGSDLTAF